MTDARNSIDLDDYTSYKATISSIVQERHARRYQSKRKLVLVAECKENPPTDSLNRDCTILAIGRFSSHIPPPR